MTLVALSMACMLVFVASGRFLWPGGIAREATRRLLGAGTLAIAITRTIDGAQWTVVAKRAGEAMRTATLAPERAADVSTAAAAEWMPRVAVGIAVFQTAVVAGTFLFLSVYFRSEKVRQIVCLKDRRVT